MSARSEEDPDARRTRLRRALVIGVLLLVPRIVLAWLVLPPVYDLTQIVAVLVFVAGLFVIGASIIRLRLLRGAGLLPVGLVGLVGVALAGIGIKLFPPSGAAVAYSGGVVAPAAAALAQWFYLLIGGLSQLGLVLLVGSIGASVARRLTAR